MSATVEITLPNGLKYEQPTGLFIDNAFVTGLGDRFSVINPAYVIVTHVISSICQKLTRLARNEEEIIVLQGASEEDVNTAVCAARKAFEGEWSDLPAVERGNFLYKLFELINRDRELIASIDAFDNGKVRKMGANLVRLSC